jgi:prevent-host-death family protein
MRVITVAEAARAFMAILKAAEDGEEVVITRAGKPVAKLVKADTPAEQPGAPASGRPRMRSIGWRNHS